MTDFTVALDNRARLPLVPYPVVTKPPPPHREADPAHAVAPRSRAVIDPAGWNPVFYEPVTKLGLIVQMALFDDPPALLVATYQYQVPPGQAGSDPALQPTKIAQYFLEPTKQNIVIVVGELEDNLPVTFSEVG